MDCRFTYAIVARGSCAKSGQASQTAADPRGKMAQNHYTTKSKRRQKNKKRKDFSAGTMAKVRQLEAAEKGKSK